MCECSVRRPEPAGRWLASVGVRADSPVLDAAGTVVGRVLSGTLSPILNEAIGSALVTTAASSQSLEVDIRGTRLALHAVKPPFVELKRQSLA